MQLRCAIIDDDEVFTAILEHYISKTGFIQLAGVYRDAASAETLLDFGKIDFLLLDVEMPGASGIDLLQSLRVSPPVILVSRKKEYGVDAFEHNCIDYILKPVSSARFHKALVKVRDFFSKDEMSKKNDRENLFIRHDRMWIKIPVNEILYIKADDNNVIIKTADKVCKTPNTLKEIYDRLPAAQFLQIHRSYIVQLKKIEKVDGEVIEINNRTLPVSKTYLKEMYKRLNISH